MERRFDLRLEALLDDAVLDPRIPEGMLERLERFVEPFAAIMESSQQERHLGEYLAGLFSDVQRKSAEAIAYLHDQDRQGLQKFIGQALLGRRPVDRGALAAGRRGVGRARRRAGVRSLGFQEAREELGGRGPAVVWASGEDRQLPSGRLSRLRLASGARLGGRAAVSAPGVGARPSAAGEVRRARRDSLPDAPCPGPGDADRTWNQAAACVDRGR